MVEVVSIKSGLQLPVYSLHGWYMLQLRELIDIMRFSLLF